METEKCKHLSTKDFSNVTLHFLAYLLEISVQIILIVNCFTSNWLLVLFTAWIVSSLFCSIVSIILTLRGMDFKGRIWGKIVCYAMHIMLIGFLWRYLKIALAYENADVEEFLKLRKLQLYAQVIPLVSIHFAFLAQSSNEGIIYCIVFGELFSAVYSLSTLSKETKAKLTIRILLLVSRVIVVGLLLVQMSPYLSLLLILVHLMSTLVWSLLSGGDQCKASECLFSQNVKNLFRSVYISFWDVLDLWDLPVFLMLVENVAVLIFHLRQQTSTNFFIPSISGTCLLLGLGLELVYKCWNSRNGQKMEEEDSEQNSFPSVSVDLQGYILEEGEQQQAENNYYERINEQIQLSTSSRNTNTISSSPTTFHIQTQQSPPVIRQASKIVLNHNNNKAHMANCNTLDNYYEDSYGILICEGEQVKSKSKSTRLKVLCAKCLGNHDPLLSCCRSVPRNYSLSETTDYPAEESDDDNNNNNDNDRDSISSTLPEGYLHTIFSLFPSAEVKKEFSSGEYVLAWLLLNDIDRNECDNSFLEYKNSELNTDSSNKRPFNQKQKDSIVSKFSHDFPKCHLNALSAADLLETVV